MKTSVAAVLALLSLTALLPAREIIVDYKKGKAANQGTAEKPYGSVAQALAVIKPGDIIRILPCPTPIADSINIQNISGDPDKPIVIDAMNNVFTGAKKLSDKEWKEKEPGLFTCERMELAQNIVRYNLIHKQRIVRMGRSTKSKASAAFKAPADLKPGEWTIVDTKPGDKTKHPYVFYLRLADGEQSPEAGQWAETGRFCGVKITSDCSPATCNGQKGPKDGCPNRHCDYITVKNLIAVHYVNDGFNIHGNCRGIAFENIAAVECGDDGLSAHNSVEFTAKNYVSLGNSTAICHINQAKSVQDGVYAEGTAGIDFFPCDSTTTELTDCWMLGDSPDGVRVNNSKDGNCLLKNVSCLNRAPKARFILGASKNTPVKATFENVRIAGYANKAKIPGVSKYPDEAALKAEILARRAAFFALFGGKLEALLGEDKK